MLPMSAVPVTYVPGICGSDILDREVSLCEAEDPSFDICDGAIGIAEGGIEEPGELSSSIGFL